MLKMNETSQKPLILGIGFGFGLIGKKMDRTSLFGVFFKQLCQWETSAIFGTDLL
jgi:hypothetical protein